MMSRVQGSTALFLAAGNVGHMLDCVGVPVPWKKDFPEASLRTVANLIKHGAEVRAVNNEVCLL